MVKHPHQAQQLHPAPQPHPHQYHQLLVDRPAQAPNVVQLFKSASAFINLFVLDGHHGGDGGQQNWAQALPRRFQYGGDAVGFVAQQTLIGVYQHNGIIHHNPRQRDNAGAGHDDRESFLNRSLLESVLSAQQTTKAQTKLLLRVSLGLH